MPKNKKKIFEDAERAISSHGLSLIKRYFDVDGSKIDKNRNEFFTKSPLRKDDHVKSGTFSINIDSGLWNDLASHENGNFIQLVSKAYGLTLLEAAEKILSDTGNYQNEPEEKQPEKKKEKKKLPPVIPIPNSAQNELQKIVCDAWNRENHGTAKAIYVYKNIKNESVFCVCRYEKEIAGKKPDKEHIPYYYTLEGWKAGRPDCKLPLYHEELLADNVLPVLIIEGEKCANIKVDGYILVSWIGGTGSVDNTDFSLLENRDIIIWPDNDEAGLKAAYKIKSKLTKSEILDIKDKPKTWDIADAQADGINIVKFISECPRIMSKESPATPYETFCRVIEEIYGSDNLEQFDGLYYYYDESKHYWTERLQKNIESDIQKWIENNHLDYLNNTDTKIHTFVSNTSMFIQRYSKAYYRVNPFKNSAIQPYIHVRNGAIEITDEGFIFHSRNEKPESFFRQLYPLFCLDVDFDMKYYEDNELKKYAPAFDYYLRSIVPDSSSGKTDEIQKTFDFFSQTLAYCLSPVKRQPKFFCMYGGQGSGKSFFLELLEKIIGENFFLVRKLKDMDNRFAAADLWGTKIFLDDDVKANLTLPDDFIKSYSGIKNITIEKKNKDAIKGVKISVAIFFISNHKFIIAGGAEGIERRLIYIPYKKKIKNPDVYLLEKIIGVKKHGNESENFHGQKFDERAAIIGFALRGLDLLIKNNYNFIMPDWVDHERTEWVINSSSISQFLHEEIYSGSTMTFSPKEIYDLYKEWCKENDVTSHYGRNNFYDKLKLEERIEFSHTSMGDLFIVEVDKKDEILGDIPF